MSFASEKNLILALKTDNPTAEIYVLDFASEKVVREKIWLAERKLAHDLLGEIDKILDGKFESLAGLIVFKGPGSFTGLRIGITTMNAIAYGETIPIVGATGEGWLSEGAEKLKQNQDDRIVLPEYGGEAHITRPKK